MAATRPSFRPAARTAATVGYRVKPLARTCIGHCEIVPKVMTRVQVNHQLSISRQPIGMDDGMDAF